MFTPDTVLLIGLALLLALGLAALRFGRWPRPKRCQEPFAAQRPAGGFVQKTPTPLSSVAGQRICAAFHAWLAEKHEGPDVWASFDQLIREALGVHLGATRVRCFHVQAGRDVLLTIHHTGKSSASCGPSVREGLLGHAATTGTEYVADDASHGPLLDDLAAQSEDGWDWIWPVRGAGRAGTTIGIIAAARLRDAAILTPELRQTVGPLLSLCWQHVTSLERLQIVQRTDQASGVLTRNDFFAVAQDALRSSYAANEPVVVAVLVLEGLRRLDDTRCWRERDALIERLGQQVVRRTRSDDVVGRFADDRFVVLLRRLDSGLGRLIAEKMLAAANESTTQLDPGAPGLEGRVRLRMGLAGSGFGQPTLQSLLGAAFDAVERARKENLCLVSDLSERGSTALTGATGGPGVPPVIATGETPVLQGGERGRRPARPEVPAP